MRGNIKILIADDTELMRLVMRGFFKKLLINPHIFETENLLDTHQQLKEEKFDLLLLDINMPNGDSSPNTVIELKMEYPDLVIVMFTGNDKKTLEAEYKAAGAFGFIQKDENMNVSTRK
ncbi:response regulator [Pedobacter aquatilis]|uniref:response regulator n=1 Tax=Pedobacter aquatilis TaxID=351343 RepID=UPI0025B61040|nr:response regulator [Pedobacter aquatilis]MDN3585796.1 response regulator [Pedobacter aquatilis]